MEVPLGTGGGLHSAVDSGAAWLPALSLGDHLLSPDGLAHVLGSQIRERVN